MTKILAIDTSTEACSVALIIDKEIKEDFKIAPRQHATLILGMVVQILKESKLKMTDLDAIAFGCGPGSFTGLRITSGVVQGLAFSSNLPVVPISTLQAMAQGAYREYKAENILCGLDARMNEIYWASFHFDENGLMQTNSKERCSKAEDMELDTSKEWIAVGDAWKVYEKQLSEILGKSLSAVYPSVHPRAGDVALLASYEFEKSGGISAELALPIYHREDLYK